MVYFKVICSKFKLKKSGEKSEKKKKRTNKQTKNNSEREFQIQGSIKTTTIIKKSVKIPHTHMTKQQKINKLILKYIPKHLTLC